MALKTYSTNQTDISLNGKQCLPDVAAQFDGLSIARSHGPRYRNEVRDTTTPKQQAATNNGEPGKEFIPPVMPSGDILYAATGVGGQKFSGDAAGKFLHDVATKLGRRAADNEGSSTFAMLAKSGDDIKMLLAGDCVISVIGRDEHGRPNVSQLTYDKVGTSVFDVPKPGAKQDQNGNYNPEDITTKVIACPDSYIGQGAYEPEPNDIITLSYKKLAEHYGEDAIIMVSTDGFYDAAIHEEYEYFFDNAAQQQYLAELNERTRVVHETYLLQAVEKLAALGYDHTNPDYAEILTRYARTQEVDHGGKKRGSYDDIGIVCIKAAKPQSPDEHAFVAVFDAIGATKIHGVTTARDAAKFIDNEVKSFSLVENCETVTPTTFRHMAYVEPLVNCQLRYAAIGTKDRIVFDYVEPELSPMMASSYRAHLSDIVSIFGAEVVSSPEHTGHNGTATIKQRTQILLDPEQAHQVEHIARFMEQHLLGGIGVKVNICHDNSLNELAASEFLEYHIQKEGTERLQHLLKNMSVKENGRYGA